MSQVIRKYKEGKPIKLDDDLLFQRDGYGSYKREDIANALINEDALNKFIKSENMNEKDAMYFRNLVSQAKLGIRDGSFTSMDELGIHNTAGFNNDGTTENKRFLGIKMPGKRSFEKSADTNDNKDNALNALNKYFKSTLDRVSKYDYDSELKAYESKHTPKPYNFLQSLANRALGGMWSNDTWYKLDYDPKTKTYSTVNRLKFILDELLDRYNYVNSHPDAEIDVNIYKDRNDYLTRWQNAINALHDGKYTPDELKVFASIGLGNIEDYLATTPIRESELKIEGQNGEVDAGWINPEYTRTRDKDGKYHIYKKGTNLEISGIIPGNVFEGTGNKYAFNGEIYDDTNLPDKYKSDIALARQAQLSDYTSTSAYNPITNAIRNAGYSYLTNLSSFAPKIGNKTLYGAYLNPSDPNSKFGFYLYNNDTLSNGSILYNNTLGEYLFIETNEDGSIKNVTNLGEYNPNGTRSNQNTMFADYNKLDAENAPALFAEWASRKHSKEMADMVRETLGKWIKREGSPFKSYNNYYTANINGTAVNVRVNEDGTLEYLINENFDDSKKSNPGKTISRKNLSPLSVHKEGGVIEKALLGTKFTKIDTKPNIQTPQLTEELKQANANADKGINGKQNVSFNEISKESTKEKGVLKTSDKVLLGAAMTDLASTVLGFVPGANIASAGLGALSSTATLGADIAADGFQWADLGRFGANIGMDFLSLIPAGKTLKGGKALTTLQKYIPLMLTALNAANITDSQVRSEYNKTLSKIAKLDLPSLDTGDIKNLNSMMGLLLGTRNIARSSLNWTNTSKPGSGKFKVSASIKGERITLDDIDKAFFENTKGSKQITLLKSRFADQYNKTHKLEGDKAIKPEDVSVDSKWLGARPKSEEIPGDATPTWFANTWLGKHTVGYKDEGLKGFDAWAYNKYKGFRNSNKPSKVLNKNKSNPTIINSKPIILLHPVDNTLQKQIDKRLGISNRRTLSDYETKLLEKILGVVFDDLKNTTNTINYDFNTLLSGNSNKQRFKLPESESPKLLTAKKSYPIVVVPKKEGLNKNAVRDRVFNKNKESLSLKILDKQTLEMQTLKLVIDQMYTLLLAAVLRARSNSRTFTAVPWRTKNTPILEMDFSKPSDKYLLEVNKLNLKILQNKKLNRQLKKNNKRSKNKPHKKELGGQLFKLGGMIPKYYSGNAMKRGTMGTWLKTENTVANAQNPETWSNYYDMPGIVSNFGTQLKAENANKFINSTNKLNAMDLPWQKLVNALGYKDWNTEYNKTGLNTYFGVDPAKFNYMGPSTWNRNLLLQNLQNTYSKANPINTGAFDVFYDNNKWLKTPALVKPKTSLTNMVTKPEPIGKLTSPHTSEMTAKVKSETNNTDSGEGIIRDAGGDSNKKRWEYVTKPADFLDLGKMLSGFVVNSLAAKEYKAGLKPVVPETYENLVLQHGNYAAKHSADKQAADMQFLANLPRTSDARDQLAGTLEGSRIGNDTSYKGGLIDSDTYYKTGLLSQLESDASKARRVDVNNQGNAAKTAIDAAKHNINAGVITAGYLNLAAPYITGIVNRMNQNEAIKRQLGLETYMNNLNLNHYAAVNNLAEVYKDNPAIFQKELAKLGIAEQELYLKDKEHLITNPWLFLKTPIAKSGSKLTYKDKAMLQQAKEFNKQLLLASKQNHKNIDSARKDYLKLLKQSSSLTAALIKKGMQL